jgi:hypothetical protein
MLRAMIPYSIKADFDMSMNGIPAKRNTAAAARG